MCGRREAQVVAALDHPNIAAIFGLEESNGVSRFLMLRAASAEVPEPIRLVQNWEAILTERSDAAP